jgi:hypothetical protein
MHNQIAWLPLHGAVAFRVCVCDALLDKAEMLSKNFVMFYEV